MPFILTQDLNCHNTTTTTTPSPSVNTTETLFCGHNHKDIVWTKKKNILYTNRFFFFFTEIYLKRKKNLKYFSFSLGELHSLSNIVVHLQQQNKCF